MRRTRYYLLLLLAVLAALPCSAWAQGCTIVSGDTRISRSNSDCTGAATTSNIYDDRARAALQRQDPNLRMPPPEHVEADWLTNHLSNHVSEQLERMKETVTTLEKQISGITEGTEAAANRGVDADREIQRSQNQAFQSSMQNMQNSMQNVLPKYGTRPRPGPTPPSRLGPTVPSGLYGGRKDVAPPPDPDD